MYNNQKVGVKYIFFLNQKVGGVPQTTCSPTKICPENFHSIVCPGAEKYNSNHMMAAAKNIR
jgi:hypothetical protein